MSMLIKKVFFAQLVSVFLLTGVISCGDDSKDSDDVNTPPTDGDGGDFDDAGAEEKGFSEMRSELTYDTSPNVSDADYETLIGNMNAFGFDLFARLTDESSNAVFSPVSIATALSMTYAGARNNTAAEMAEALHNDLSDEVFHAASNQLMLDLSDRNIAPYKVEDAEGEKSLQLSLVNGIWAQEDYGIESDFLDTLAVNYDSGVKLVDFINDWSGAEEIINDWVFDNTQEKIDNLLGPGALGSDTRMVLTNALYFYGSWQNTFDTGDTQDQTFTTLDEKEITVSMMQKDASFSFGEKDGYKVLDIPYDGGLLSMTVVLPDAGRFNEIRGAVTQDWSEQAFGNLTATEVLLKLPKFSFTWGSTSLKDPLEALGMKDAFSSNADFTGINPASGLFVSDVLHKAFIGVDEYGTEAAAATAVVMNYVSLPDSSASFCADRPFLFFIRDTSGLVLFAGQVTDPS